MNPKRIQYVETKAPQLLLEMFKGKGLIAPSDVPKYVAQCVTAAGLMFDQLEALREEKAQHNE